MSTCLTRHGVRLDFDSETFVTNIAGTLNANGKAAGPCRLDQRLSTPVAFAATDYESGAFDQVDQAAPLTTSADRTRAAPILAFKSGQSEAAGGTFVTEEFAPTLQGQNNGSTAVPAVAVALRGRDGGATAELGDETSNALRASSGGGDKAHVLAAMQVRRLTVRECERLQGFEDDYTLIPYGRPSKAKLDADFLKYQLRGNPKHLKREDLDRLAADGPRYKALGNSWAVPCARWIGQRIEAVRSRDLITAIQED